MVASLGSACTAKGVFDARRHHPGSEVDLAAAENGGQVLLVQRHVLRQPAQPHHAGPLDAHGRRLGDASPSRTGPRLDDREARHARHAASHRDRHRSLQGQRAGPLHGRGRATRRSVPNGDVQALASRVGAWHVAAARDAAPATHAPSLHGPGGPGAGDARQAQHLSRRRHRADASVTACRSARERAQRRRRRVSRRSTRSPTHEAAVLLESCCGVAGVGAGDGGASSVRDVGANRSTRPTSSGGRSRRTTGVRRSTIIRASASRRRPRHKA